jgi:hypothetical protein
MMPGKDGTGKVVKALSAFFTLIALPGRLFLIEASSDNSSGYPPVSGELLSWIGKCKIFLYHIKTLESNMSLKKFVVKIYFTRYIECYSINGVIQKKTVEFIVPGGCADQHRDSTHKDTWR